MAASGYTPIITYNSSTTGNNPLSGTGAITTGELAINITDGKLFVGTGTNTYKTLLALSNNSSITAAGNVSFLGSFTSAFTLTANTAVTLPTSGTLVNTSVTTLSSLASIGTITTGVWNGTLISPTYGGTGVNNGSSTLTLAGNVTHAGAFTQSFTATANTAVTLPTSGTLISSVTALSGAVTGTPSSTTYLRGDSTWATISSNPGTVTSVAMSVPAFLSVSGSPITSSGTLAVTLSGTALPIANGGTGLTSTPSNGQLDIGNGSGFTRTTLTAGTGITVTNGSGSITIASTASGGSQAFVAFGTTGGF